MSNDSKETITWKGEEYPMRADRELERMAFDSIAKTPDGREVEPDHPDSWLRVLGMI